MKTKMKDKGNNPSRSRPNAPKLGEQNEPKPVKQGRLGEGDEEQHGEEDLTPQKKKSAPHKHVMGEGMDEEVSGESNSSDEEY